MVSQQKHRQERRVLEQFYSRLSLLDGEKAEEVSPEDRRHGGCEAIISRRGILWAVEHTTVDSYPLQRLEKRRFVATLWPVREDIMRAFPRDRVTIAVGSLLSKEWRAVGDLGRLFRDACLSILANLPSSDRPSRLEPRELPFPIWVSREAGHRYPACRLMTSVPEDVELTRQEPIRKALANKKLRLKPYRHEKKRTALIMDCDDLALFDPFGFAAMFANVVAAEDLSWVDEIYLAETYADPIWFYPLKLGEAIYPGLAEFDRFWDAQFALTYPGLPRG